MSLAQTACEPCRGGMPPLRGDGIRELLEQLDPAWEVVDEHHLRRAFTFPDFAQPLALLVEVGRLAEEMGHHPDLHLSWGRLVVEIHTHAIDGLHLADFVLAAQIDEVQGG